MALSNAERRALRGIESALARDDPVFTAAMTTEPVPGRPMITATLVYSVGVAALIAAMVLLHGLLAVGVLAGVTGFLTMLMTVAVALKDRIDETVDRRG